MKPRLDYDYAYHQELKKTQEELKDLEHLLFEFFFYFSSTTLMPESGNLERFEKLFDKFRSKYLNGGR